MGPFRQFECAPSWWGLKLVSAGLNVLQGCGCPLKTRHLLQSVIPSFGVYKLLKLYLQLTLKYIPYIILELTSTKTLVFSLLGWRALSPGTSAEAPGVITLLILFI